MLLAEQFADQLLPSSPSLPSRPSPSSPLQTSCRSLVLQPDRPSPSHQNERPVDSPRYSLNPSTPLPLPRTVLFLPLPTPHRPAPPFRICKYGSSSSRSLSDEESWSNLSVKRQRLVSGMSYVSWMEAKEKQTYWTDYAALRIDSNRRQIGLHASRPPLSIENPRRQHRQRTIRCIRRTWRKYQRRCRIYSIRCGWICRRIFVLE